MKYGSRDVRNRKMMLREWSSRYGANRRIALLCNCEVELMVQCTIIVTKFRRRGGGGNCTIMMDERQNESDICLAAVSNAFEIA